MAQYLENHFYDQFKKYPEGEERFRAAARHAAMLLNKYAELEVEEQKVLITIRNALINGESIAKIALAIQERLETKYDTQAEIPTLEDL